MCYYTGTDVEMPESKRIIYICVSWTTVSNREKEEKKTNNN